METVHSHASLNSKLPGGDLKPPDEVPAYPYALEGVILKDGLSVGAITVSVSSLSVCN